MYTFPDHTIQPKILFTFDLENHRSAPEYDQRVIENTEVILDFLERIEIRATFFVVGSFAARNQNFIKKIHAKKHEIACHSLNHIPLSNEEPTAARKNIARAKNILENIIGDSVTGYRAPIFSLTKNTLWMTDILKESGFVYSSSTVPATNPLHGFSALPNQFFRWENGLYEFPLPVTPILKWKIPFLGGIYIRYLPSFFIASSVKRAQKTNPLLWSYIHPYDYDRTEWFYAFPNTPWIFSFMLWRRRRGTLNQLKKIPFASQTFTDIIHSLPNAAPA